jgi:hypothetical protein
MQLMVQIVPSLFENKLNNKNSDGYTIVGIPSTLIYYFHVLYLQEGTGVAQSV